MGEIERREQVFVSSTYLDLKDERQEVIQTLLEANCIPAGMEMFPASDDDRWTLIKREIDHSDYYLVVVGGRYGSVDPDRGLSYTEMEFDYAADLGVPILGFLHGEPGKIEVNKSDVDPDLAAKLEGFRAKVSEKVVKFWTTPDGLGGQVAKSLIKIRQSHPAVGWIRGEKALTPEVEAELRELRARVRELEAESKLSEQRKAIANVVADVPGFVEVDYTFIFKSKEDVGVTEYRRKKLQHTGKFEVSIESFLQAAGPSMLIEASEVQLIETLQLMVWGYFLDSGLPEEFESLVSFKVTITDLQTILFRMFSQGLIEESTRKHVASDNRRYWRLSLVGKEKLIVLDARGTAEPEGDDDLPDQE